MSEASSVAAVQRPSTVETLSAGLAVLGVREGQVLVVHTSMRALGWVCGGADAVIQALTGLIGARGTLVMPAHSAGLSEPSGWQRPPIPPDWWSIVRETMPAFDRQRTPTRCMGATAELFRTLPGTVRSNHPTASVAASGPRAAEIVRVHSLEDPMGLTSPWATLYELGAQILLLGVGHERNTALHLAERKAFRERQRRVETGAPISRAGQRRWVTYEEPDVSNDDFERLGADFEGRTSSCNLARVGAAQARLMPLRALVDFAERWLLAHRTPDGYPTER